MYDFRINHTFELDNFGKLFDPSRKVPANSEINSTIEISGYKLLSS